ncbi:chaperonin CPN60-2, mitochondrial-like [Henckelia pumila]|uniref:chaperonin CPN60-2, mitochondrial-like n=1 Tax=Henckelia pumila TaxID=405737 RepID=UPI003C6E98CE
MARSHRLLFPVIWNLGLTELLAMVARRSHQFDARSYRIEFGEEARSSILKGVNDLRRDVLIEHSTGVSKVTRDSLKVINNTFFKGYTLKYLGKPYKRGAAFAAVMAREIFVEGTRLAAEGYNYVDLRRGIEMAIENVVVNLKSNAKKMRNKEDIAKVATIFVNGHKDVGELIANTMEKVGCGGAITVQGGNRLINELEFVQVLQLMTSYILHMDDSGWGRSTYVIMKILEVASQKSRPLFIVAKDLAADVLETLVVNQDRFDVKVNISKHDSIILDGAGEKKVTISSAIEWNSLDNDKKKITRRLANLVGGAAVIRIGVNEIEVSEKKKMVADSIRAMNSAIEEETVIGRFYF